MIEFLSNCVRAKLNMLVSGGTGSGKTTLLNILSGYIGNDERVVTIEDAAELQLHQEHVARLETRPANVEGKGAVPQRQLVINALRMRPDRIVVGEVRGGEALDMLQAMNTGHDGSLTTVHANTPRDALSRIETMISMSDVSLPQKAMRQQISSAINIVVQQARLGDGTRKITSVSEITGMEGDVITMQEIFRFDRLGIDEQGKVRGRFLATGVRPQCCDKLQAEGIPVDPAMFEGSVEV
jgi:pilus assembly protein CpaF